MKLKDTIKLDSVYCAKCCCTKDESSFYRVKLKLDNICITCVKETLLNSKRECPKCGEVKESSDFTVYSKSKDFISYSCKSCAKNNLKTYPITAEEKSCPICKNILQSSEFTRNNRIKDGLSSYCRKCTTQNTKKYIRNNKILSEKRLQRSKNDSQFRFSNNVRNLIWQSFKRACDGKYKKSEKTETILGCTIPEFIKHLQSLFKEGMTLENNGQCVECWHIDHKIPLASAKNEEDIIKLCHYTNLQPMWSRENISKNSKII